MDAADRDWLRTNRHHIKLGHTDEGHVQLDFDDHHVFDAMNDYLTEDCDGLGDQTYYFNEDGTRMVFEPHVTFAQLEALIAQI